MRYLWWLCALLALVMATPAQGQLRSRGQCYWKVMNGDLEVSQHQQESTALNRLLALGLADPTGNYWFWHDCVIDFDRQATAPAEPPLEDIGEEEVDPTGDDIIGAPEAPLTTLVAVGQSLQAAADSLPEGSTIGVAAGVHRMQSVLPRNGQQFVGQPGAVLSGARVLALAWQQDGDRWWIPQERSITQVHGNCRSERPRCGHAQELFIDDSVQVHVATLAEVAPGRWYFDYDNGRVYIGEAPAGKVVELSVTAHAFLGTADGVVVRGLTIEKYATMAQRGTVHARDGRNWRVEDNVIRWNHGTAVSMGDSTQVLRNQLLANGQMALAHGGRGSLVEDNEIAYNNTAGFDWGWEGGSTKFANSIGLVVRGNDSHHNNGPGLWLDINNLDCLVEGNTVEDNPYMGIFHEIGYDCVIRNNTVRRNGFIFSDAQWGAGILIANSGCVASPPQGYGYSPRLGDDGRRVCVEVYGNTVEDNADGISAQHQDRGSGAYGPWLTRGVYVHDNVVRLTERSGNTGLAGSLTLDPGLTTGDNRWDRNTYHLDLTAKSTWFAWPPGSRTFSQWQALGQDTNGTIQQAQ